MTDADTEQKNPIWPWVAAAVVGTVILLFVFIHEEVPAEKAQTVKQMSMVTGVDNRQTRYRTLWMNA